MSQIKARFIIIIRDSFIPIKKGPLKDDEQVTEYLKELPKHYPGAKFIVAEIAYGDDLWLTDGKEWLWMAAMDDALDNSNFTD
jgi:hypothetical protein